MAAPLKLPVQAQPPRDDVQLDPERYRDYIKLPKSIAAAWRKFLAERPTGSFEIHCQDGVVKSATRRSVHRASDEE
jgi:hypothetical protein